MIFTKCDTDIEIIQGDTIQKNIEIVDVDTDSIVSVYFSCDKLNIVKELTKDDDHYILKFESSETLDMPIINTDYDITIVFDSDVVKTGIFRGKLYVYKKTNRIS